MVQTALKKTLRIEKRKQLLAKMKKAMPKRNDSLFDGWSIVHTCSGIVLGWIMAPFFALVLMVLWEPFEIFLLGPYLSRFGIVFGYESLRNSLSDIFFDVIGVTIGAWVLAMLVTPPFHLF